MRIICSDARVTAGNITARFLRRRQHFHRLWPGEALRRRFRPNERWYVQMQCKLSLNCAATTGADVRRYTNDFIEIKSLI